jgi:CheY-like chemotaxis protein
MTASTHTLRVLVAEDDRAIRRLMGMTLRRASIEVQLTEDGAEALAALQQSPWNAIVLDLMMPEVNGWEVVRWLGLHPEHRPPCVVVVSAAGPDVLRDLDPTIVNAIFFKPFDVVQLGEYLQKAMQHDGEDRRRARVVKSIT